MYECIQRYLDAYNEGATSLDIVAKTRELKKRHRAPLVMQDDQKNKVYHRRRRVKGDVEDGSGSEGESGEDVEGGEQGNWGLAELHLLGTQLSAPEATHVELIAALTRLSALEVT